MSDRLKTSTLRRRLALRMEALERRSAATLDIVRELKHVSEDLRGLVINLDTTVGELAVRVLEQNRAVLDLTAELSEVVDWSNERHEEHEARIAALEGKQQ